MRVWLAWLFVALALAGCARNGEEDTLRIGGGAVPTSLDPQRTSSVAAIQIQHALFEGLVRWEPKDGSVVPALAEEWKVDDSGRVWTFQLRESAVWSDGHAITAHDFVESYRRALHPDMASPLAGLLYPIQGARAYTESARPEELADELGVEAVDDYSLVIRLEYAVPSFLERTMHPMWFPLPRHHIRNHGQWNDRSSSWALPEKLVGSGPFMIASREGDTLLVLEPNPLYHAAHEVSLDRLEFHFIADAHAEERAFLAGQLDITDTVPPSRVSHYISERHPEFRLDPYMGSEYVLFNTELAPCDDIRVRQALSLAVNRELLVERVMGAHQKAAGSFAPPELLPPYSGELLRGSRNEREARRLLEEAGYPNGEGFPVLEFIYNTSARHQQVSEYLQSVWREVLGVDISIRNLEWKTYLAEREAGRFHLARASWIADYMDASNFLEILTTDHPSNHAGWSHERYDELVLGGHDLGGQARRQRYLDAEAILREERPVLPVFHYVTAYLISDRVSGWHSHPLDWHRFERLSLADAP